MQWEGVVGRSNERSEEIGHEVPVVLAGGALLDSLKYHELAVVVLVQAQDGRLVAHPVAVVGGRPQRHQLLVEPEYVPLLHQLVRSHYQAHLVQQVELVHHLVPEYPPRPPRVPAPGLDVLGVRPHQVSQRSLVGDLLLPVQQPHLVEGGQVRRQPPMHAQDRAVHDSAEGEEVEGLVEVLPAVGVAVLFVDFVQEAVHHGDVSALVVAPQQVDPVRVPHLQAEQQRYCLDRVVAPVHEVPYHYELSGRDPPSPRQQVLNVVELAVDIPREVDGRVDADDVALLCEDGLDLVAEGAHS